MCSFMDINWQYDNPPNPADAAIGPQGYDNHLYYSYGVRTLATSTTLSYLTFWYRVWPMPTLPHIWRASAVRTFLTTIKL